MVKPQNKTAMITALKLKTYLKRKTSWAGLIICLWIFVALCQPIISNNRPIIAISKSGLEMPILQKGFDNNKSYSFKINPPIPYKFNDLDINHSLLPPGSPGLNGTHWLGTDKLGRDVAAGMINGARSAIIIVILTIFFSVLIGAPLGLLAGYFGDYFLKKNILQQVFATILFIIFVYYFYSLLFLHTNLFSILAMTIVLVLLYFGDGLLGRLPIKKFGVPIDFSIQRIFEVKKTIPGLFVILPFAATLSKPNLFNLSAIMVVLIWVTFALHFRSETLNVRNEDYIRSAKVSGLSDFQVLSKHIIPNIIPHIYVVIAFTCSSVILLEATLSFLGIGTSIDQVSWGKLLTQARLTPKAWWLAVFPGLAIFLIIFAFNKLGEIYSNRYRS